jgi:hypothetical protein
MKFLLWMAALTLGALSCAAQPYLSYKGTNGPGMGKHIVLLAGDEEYRSEEAMPMLARILAYRHGFKCTVLFSINPASGTIDPVVTTNLPGLETLSSADLCFMFVRFRDLPDSQMRHFVDYVNSGKPILAIRTSTHAFAYGKDSASAFAKYDWRSKEWPGGFGQQVLGETWVSHHGDHGKESTRGVVSGSAEAPGKFKPSTDALSVLNGVKDVWGPTDVYTVAHLPEDAQVLMWGQVLRGMKPDDAPLEGAKNDPMMPVVWLRNYTGTSGKNSKMMTSTIGAAVDLQSEDLRRLFINACYYLNGLKVPGRADARYVGEYNPTWFGFGKFTQGVKPLELK